jgi:hypothetical protein
MTVFSTDQGRLGVPSGAYGFGARLEHLEHGGPTMPKQVRNGLFEVRRRAKLKVRTAPYWVGSPVVVARGKPAGASP